MDNRIKQELVSAQAAQARAYARIEAIRASEATIEAITALRDEYWSFWVDCTGVYLGTSVHAVDSIMFDSPIAELLTSIEALVGGDFTSVLTGEGDVEYRLRRPGFGRVVITAYLTEEGACRKVVKGYEKRTRSHLVEVEEAVPVYGIACGEGA